MAILEHITNNTPYRLYANGNPKALLSKRDNGIAGIIMRVVIFNFLKNFFGLQWPSWKVHRLYANGSPEGTLSNRSSGITGINLRFEINSSKQS